MSKSNEEIFNLLQQVAKTVNDTKEELKSFKQEVRKEINCVKKENLELKQELEFVKNKLHAVEKKQKKYNLVVYGIKGDEVETKTNLLDILNTKLNIDCVETEIRDIYRIGKLEEGKVRPTLVEFLRYQTKAEIINKSRAESRKLRDIGIRFALDLPTEDYLKNKFLYSQAKLAKEKGLRATVKNFSLTVNGETYSYEQLSCKSPEATEGVPGLERTVQGLPHFMSFTQAETQNVSEERKRKLKDADYLQTKYTLRERKRSGSK